jgi:hypothetical protein
LAHCVGGDGCDGDRRDRAAAAAPIAPLHRVVHGTDDPAAIAGQLDRLLDGTLGARPAGGLFHVASVGSVTGIGLTDGRRVVVKAFPPRYGRRFLGAVGQVQDALVADGLPCARRLAGPEPVGRGLATVEAFLDDPGQPSAFGPDEQRASARGLARLIEVAPRVDGLEEHPLRTEDGELYPEPHSPLFDFDATAAGAEWIDALAEVARPCLRLGRLVVGHTDWAARNVRLSADGVLAIYDVDSIALAPLAAVVGQAAVCWRATGDSGEATAPGVAEVDEWMRELPIELSDEERRAVDANVLYHLAYSSRCEHAIDPDGRRHLRARPTLRSAGPILADRLSAPPPSAGGGRRVG